MSGRHLSSEKPAFQSEWDAEDVRMMFFKCVRWQVEETLDPINCPYHYFCDSTYPGNYPPAVDILLLLFATASYLVILFFTAMEISGGRSFHHTRRYLLPTGPVSFPVILVALAKGCRINTIFPLSSVGPAILQLLHISALSFNIEADSDIKYAFLETSTISGILHASLFLDSVILPYYTGFDALVSSTFSGECKTCICRKEVLVVGGMLVSYRGWSTTMFVVVGTLCLRIICRMTADDQGKVAMFIRSVMESLCWVLITMDAVYLTKNSPPQRSILRCATFGGVLVLICLHFLRKVCAQLRRWHSGWCKKGCSYEIAKNRMPLHVDPGFRFN